MRKLLTVLASLAVFSSLMPAASAMVPEPRQHHETVCYVLIGNGGDFLADGCVTVNTNDTAVGEIEGLAWAGNEQFTSVQVKFDYVHLRRNGALIETTNGTAWLGISGTTSHSTDWNNINTSGDIFRAVVRMRVRRSPSHNAGPWQTFDTNNWTCGTYC